MGKIIAREYAPENIDFSGYFDCDGFKSISGENCAVYIIGDRRIRGFNDEEYQSIVTQAEAIADSFKDIGNGDHWDFGSYEECMEYCGVKVTDEKCELLKKWVKNADTTKTDELAEYLTITTGAKWEARSFMGYSQGDYCEVVYCTEEYSEDGITEIGKLWLGCGTEFEIDGVGGYYIIDDIRWKENLELVNLLAEYFGCKADDLEVHLYVGEHTVTDYKVLKIDN